MDEALSNNECSIERVVNMKFVAIDEINHFEYHDAVIKKMEIIEDKMTWIVSELNATIQNSQNSFIEDMCINECEIIFDHYKIEEIIFSAYKIFDSNQNLIESVDARTADFEDYIGIIEDTMKNSCRIVGMIEMPETSDGRKKACFGIDGNRDYFDITFSFTKFTARWNEYNGKAWYEDKIWKEKA